MVNFKGGNMGNDIMKIIIKDRKDEINRKLKPFQAEITDCGGKITVNITNNPRGISVSFTYKNIPKKLEDKINLALGAK